MGPKQGQRVRSQGDVPRRERERCTALARELGGDPNAMFFAVDLK
jgi:hypothetical protein